jgi:hypothetical protein
MNIAIRNVPAVRLVPPVWKTTETGWWWWKSARIAANTTIPRISNSTPVLLINATRLTPKMFSSVIAISVTIANQRSFEWLSARFQPMLLKAGISASGSVAHTEVIAMIPANR